MLDYLENSLYWSMQKQGGDREGVSPGDWELLCSACGTRVWFYPGGKPF